jgi:peptidoglycan/xylan/chitin deacetylase (PgdA/CDA1 family)
MLRRLAFSKKTYILFFLLASIIIGIAGIVFVSDLLESRPLQDADQFTNPQPVLPIQSSSTATMSAVHVPILMYHYIEHVKDVRDTFRQKLDIYPEILDLQLKTLSEAGFTFLTMSQVGEVLDGKASLPEKPIVLTFDDGYRDFYTDAFPVLEKYHVKSTAYIISGFLGKPNYMTVNQVKDIARSGIVEVAAHTEHHIDLQHASLTKATQEIVGSKQALEQLISSPVVSFAYPGGRFNPSTVDVVKQAGFTTAVSTLPGSEVAIQNRFILFRLRPGSRTGQHLLDFLTHVVTKTKVRTMSQPE